MNTTSHPVITRVTPTLCHCEESPLPRHCEGHGSGPWQSAVPHRLSLRGACLVAPKQSASPRQLSLRASVRRRGNLSFCIPQYALVTGDCFVVPLALLAMTLWGRPPFCVLSLRGACFVAPKQSRSSVPKYQRLLRRSKKRSSSQ